MSKSKKILATIICAVLLVGALCVAVFAEDEPGRVTFPSLNTDFEGWACEHNANTGDGDTWIKGLQVIMSKTYGHFSSATYEDENGKNTYARFWNNKDTVYEGDDAKATGTPWVGINGGGYGLSNTWRLVDYDYVTVDFEFCSDKYMDPVTKEFISEYKEGAVLAYPENAYFDLWIRGQTVNNSQPRMCVPVQLHFKLENGVWYLQHGSSTKISISQEAGVWNHLTLVMAIDRTPLYKGKLQSGWQFSNSDIYIYLNGECVSKTENFIKEDVNVGATVDEGGELNSLLSYDQFRITLPTTVRKNQAFSIGIDNIQTNYYEAGYSGGLDKVITDPTKSLAEAEGAVIAGLYNRPYPSEPAAVLDGTDFYYPEATYHHIKSDSVLEIFKSFETPYHVEVPFIVKSNGNTFAYTTDAYELQKVGSDYYFVNTTDPIRIIFDGDPSTAYQGALYNDSVTLTLNSVPKYPLEIPYELEYVYHEDDEKVWHFIGWSHEKNSTVPLESMPSITQDDVYYGCYYLYPVYEKLESAYFVEIKDGDKTVKTGYYSYDLLAYNLNADGAKIIFNTPYTSTDILSIENNIALEVNGNTVLYYSSTKIADFENGTYTFRDVKDEEKVTVNWYAVGDHELKNPIGTQTEIPGNTISYTTFDNKALDYGYSSVYEKMLEYTGWSDVVDNGASEALSGGLYTIPLSSDGLDFYPTYTKHDCAFFVEYEGVKTGYLTYDKVEDYITLPGATVHFVTPYSDFIYVEDSVTLVPYENTFVYYSETKIADIVDGSYVFRDVTPDDYVEVSWVDLNGVVQKTEKHIPGNTINTPKINSKIEGNISPTDSNSFYKVYVTWEKQYKIQPLGEGGTNPNVFKPTNNSESDIIVEADIKDIKYSFSANSDFKLNLYVPDPQNAKISITASNKESVTVGGKSYIYLPDVIAISPTETGKVTASFSFSFYGIDRSWEVEVSLPEYFAAVLAKSDSTKEEKELVIAAANYCNMLYKIENGTDFEAYTDIISENSDFFTAIDTVIASDAASATDDTLDSRITPYVSGMKVYYDPTVKAITYAFIVKAEADGLAPGSLDADDTGLELNNYGITVVINGVKYGTKLVEEEIGDEKVTMLVVDMNGDTLPIYQQINEIQFSIFKRYIDKRGNDTLELIRRCGGKSYSASIYLNQHLSDGTEDVSMLKTIYAFSYAAQQYNASLEKADDDIVIADAK